MTILDKIIQKKRLEVEQLKKESFEVTYDSQKIPSFRNSILKRDTMGVIAEFKRASPSKGVIRADLDPYEQAKTYETYGASAISVLTDTPFFQGTIDDLIQARQAVNLPILCKDFMIDEIQIDRARAAGATLILLIAAALDDDELHRLFSYAKERNLEVLCEVNNEAEMERVLALEAKIIGINNRDLKTFHVSLDTTARLAQMVTDPETVLVSESGIKTKADVEKVASYGARAILVGETLMRSENVADTLPQLQVNLPQEMRK